MAARNNATIALIIGVVATGILAATGGILAVVPIKDGLFNTYGQLIGGDFPTFHAAGYALVHGDVERVYDDDYFNQLQDFLVGEKRPDMSYAYPPYALFLFAPLGFPPYIWAYWGWLTAMAAATVWFVRRASGGLWFALFVLSSPLFVKAVITGQTGVLVAALFGIAAVNDRQPRIAGVLWGMTAVKPQLALLVPLFLAATGRWRALVAAGAAFVFMTLASLIILGPESWMSFLGAVGSHSGGFHTAENIQWVRSPSVFLMFIRMTGNPSLAWTGQVTFAVAALGAARYVWRNTSSQSIQHLALASATALVISKVHDYDLAIFLVPLAFMGRDFLEGRLVPVQCAIFLVLWCFPFLSIVAGHLGWNPGPLLLAFALYHAVAETNAQRRLTQVSKPE